MFKQLSILDAIAIHSRENNPESQAHLNENKSQFTDGCRKVLRLLQEGKRLTTIDAPSYGILSLPRRIADLRQYNRIVIQDKWIKTPSGKKIKEWFI